jgi:hypothetical protein
MHLGISGWNGLTMLYLAGWYGELVGISCCYALSLTDDKIKYDEFTDWLMSLPILMIANDVTTDSATGKRIADYGYYSNAGPSPKPYREREYPLTPGDIAPYLPAGNDFASLEQARNSWLRCDASSKLTAKATLISTSKGNNEDRSDEAISFVYAVLQSPERLPDLLDKRMLSWE